MIPTRKDASLMRAATARFTRPCWGCWGRPSRPAPFLPLPLGAAPCAERPEATHVHRKFVRAHPPRLLYWISHTSPLSSRNPSPGNAFGKDSRMPRKEIDGFRSSRAFWKRYFFVTLSLRAVGGREGTGTGHFCRGRGARARCTGMHLLYTQLRQLTDRDYG
jgi:hypothetical protein